MMSALRLKFRSGVPGRIDVSNLRPSRVAGLSLLDVARLPLGSDGHVLGDVFQVLGASGDTIVIEGGSAAMDFAGAGLDGGTLVIEGDAGAYAGKDMKAGRIEIKGNAGPYLASGMSGGLVTVDGSAAENVGGLAAGAKYGMTGGTVVVAGDIGARAGDRMRRGTIIAKGKAGPAAGSRMVGGTIWAVGGFGDGPGPLMRRGTLIGSSASRLLPTFADCGHHELVVVRLIMRHLADTLGPLAPKPVTGPLRRWAGDLATIGKGEVLLLA